MKNIKEDKVKALDLHKHAHMYSTQDVSENWKEKIFLKSNNLLKSMFSPCFAARGASEQFVQTFVKKKNSLLILSTWKDMTKYKKFLKRWLKSLFYNMFHDSPTYKKPSNVSWQIVLNLCKVQMWIKVCNYLAYDKNILKLLIRHCITFTECLNGHGDLNLDASFERRTSYGGGRWSVSL